MAGKGVCIFYIHPLIVWLHFQIKSFLNSVSLSDKMCIEPPNVAYIILAYACTISVAFLDFKGINNVLSCR